MTATMPRRGASAGAPPPHVRRVRARLAAIFAVLLVPCGGAGAQDATSTSFYRIFLTNGTALASYGEYTRAGDRVVFAMPLGNAAQPDSLQLVSLPAGVVDWDRTTRYANSVRYQRYAATRGDADYRALTDMVARALTDIRAAKDSTRRLAIAEDARRQLVEWPAAHFGFRASNVRDLTTLVEEIISDIRANAGGRQFDLNLVAMIEPPSDPLMSDPTAIETVDLASAVTRISDIPVERRSLQQAILATLDRHQGGLPAAWVKSTRGRLHDSMVAETRVDTRYAKLTSRALADASARAAEADVTGVERVIAGVRAKDTKLGGRRPEQIASLLVSLDAHVEAARVRRLAWDRWAFRVDTYRRYRHDVDRHLERLSSLVRDVERIRLMAGPDIKRVSDLERRAHAIGLELGVLQPPQDLKASHDALSASVRLIEDACRLRREAVATVSIDLARNASTAAAGSLVLLNSARAGIKSFFSPPQRP